jgi:hypothetical protein
MEVQQWLADRTAQAPQWLAMAAYVTLAYAYITTGLSFRVLSTVVGYLLLFMSKYYKDKHNDKKAKQFQAIGYTCVVLGLHFTHWRDVLAVVGYALAFANVVEANVILSLGLAFAARSTHSIPLLLARVALILYML